MAKSTYHHGNLKVEAIRAAVQLSRKESLFNWTLRSLAKKMGVSHVALYNHFESKEDLLYEVAIFGFQELLRLSQIKLSFREIGLVYIEFATKNPEVFEAMFHPLLPPSGSMKFQAAASEYLTLVHESINRDFSRRKSKDRIFVKAWAAVHGFAQLASRGLFKQMDLQPEATSPEAFLEFLWK